MTETETKQQLWDALRLEREDLEHWFLSSNAARQRRIIQQLRCCVERFQFDDAMLRRKAQHDLQLERHLAFVLVSQS